MMEVLIAEYDDFLAKHNLPNVDGEELLICHDLTSEQRNWLIDFSNRWEEMWRNQ